MSDPAASPPQTPAVRLEPSGPEHCIAKRRDGVYADPAVLGTTFLAAFDGVLLGNSYFTDLDYPILIKALYDYGPDLPRTASGEATVRFASDIVPFDPARRELYRSVKISDGKAEYYFEPVYLPDPDDPEGTPLPVRLDIDEFIAGMWVKGIRFGIDVDAVRAAIADGAAGRVEVARRLDPAPGQDAHIIEVSDDLHRSDAPRQLANGKLDLMSFQNRFPQIHKGVKLLKKVPRRAGTGGFELSGIPLEPALPGDVDLAAFSGLGTTVERTGEGEFLVSQQAGFLSVDGATSQISVGDKIVSHDGVSARTTGNLQLTGDYEEFGEVQEKRVIEGGSITVHADVFGNIVSRGGTVLLNHNLVGGSAHNKQGDIRIKGVASGAVIQASCGEVVLQRAENCIVSGTRVTVAQAVNCEIIGDEVVVGQAEGCAIAGRKVTIDSAAPRRQNEMVVYALRPDCAQIDEVVAQLELRVAQFGELVARHKAHMERLTGQTEVRRYIQLAGRVRRHEITLSPEQLAQFQQMALAVGPALKAIGKASHDVKAAEAERQAGLSMMAQLERQRIDSADMASVTVRAMAGDTQVRALAYDPAGGSTYDLAPRDIKARLRGGASTTLLFGGSRGAFDWSSEGEAAAA